MIRFSPYRGFLLLCAASLVVGWRPLAATFSLALQSEAYTHVLLVLPVSAALIFSAGGLRVARPERNFRSGSAVLLVALSIGCLAWIRPGGMGEDLQLSLYMAGIITWWVGAFIYSFGIHTLQKNAFPLLLLLWMVPLPEFVLGRVVGFLQQESASAARMLFAAAGVPVVQDGVVLSIPGLKIEVAKECSSIRSSLMLVVTSMVMAQLVLRTSWGKAVAILAAIPLSVIKNAIRIFTVSMLTVYVDPGFLNGRLHHQGGIVFFLAALGVEFALLVLLAWIERKATAQPAGSRFKLESAAPINPAGRISIATRETQA